MLIFVKLFSCLRPIWPPKPQKRFASKATYRERFAGITNKRCDHLTVSHLNVEASTTSVKSTVYADRK